MNNIESLMNKGRRSCAAIIGLAAIAMLLTNSSQVWPGVLMGLSVGYFNLEILYRRVGKSNPDDPAYALRLMRMGSGLRFVAAALGALTALKYNLNILGYAGGLIIPQIIITVVCGMQGFREGKG